MRDKKIYIIFNTDVLYIFLLYLKDNHFQHRQYGFLTLYIFPMVAIKDPMRKKKKIFLYGLKCFHNNCSKITPSILNTP